MDQKAVVHLHTGILHSRNKEGAPTFHDSMDGTGEHYVKWNKPGSEGQIPYDLAYKWNLINKTNKQAEYNQRYGNKEQADSNQRGGNWDDCNSVNNKVFFKCFFIPLYIVFASILMFY